MLALLGALPATVAAPGPVPGVEIEAKEARKVMANLSASAFFKNTTCTLPDALCELGWSSLTTRDFTNAKRAALAERTMSALLRGSAITVVLTPVSD